MNHGTQHATPFTPADENLSGTSPGLEHLPKEISGWTAMLRHRPNRGGDIRAEREALRAAQPPGEAAASAKRRPPSGNGAGGAGGKAFALRNEAFSSYKTSKG